MKPSSTKHTLQMKNSFNVAIREVTEGGDPLEDFVDYDPFHGASDDQLTEICNDIYDYLLLGTLNA